MLHTNKEEGQVRSGSISSIKKAQQAKRRVKGGATQRMSARSSRGEIVRGVTADLNGEQPIPKRRSSAV